MHWICPLYKLSTSWAFFNTVLRGVESCWVKFKTDQIFCSTRLNISFVLRSSMRDSTKSSAFAQQRSTCWAHARTVPSVSKDSQPWFSMSLCEIFGLLNMLSNSWGHLNTALNNTSTNMLRACTVDKSSALARSLSDNNVSVDTQISKGNTSFVVCLAQLVNGFWIISYQILVNSAICCPVSFCTFLDTSFYLLPSVKHKVLLS